MKTSHNPYADKDGARLPRASLDAAEGRLSAIRFDPRYCAALLW